MFIRDEDDLEFEFQIRDGADPVPIIDNSATTPPPLTPDLLAKLRGNGKDKLLVKDLKAELTRRGLSDFGKAGELRSRLERRWDTPYTTLPGMIPGTARWMLLQPTGVVPLPGYDLPPGGVPVLDPDEPPVNHPWRDDYSGHVFNRVDEFGGQECGGPNPEWMMRNKISAFTHPIKIVNHFWPLSDFAEQAGFMNKRMFNDAVGVKGGCYRDFSDTTPWNKWSVAAHVALEGMQGLAPTPRTAWMVDPKHELHYVPSVAEALGRVRPGEPRINHKVFHKVMTVVDPNREHPSPTANPLWRLGGMTNTLNARSKEAWIPGRDFSVDEMVCAFQGSAPTKERCGGFKNAGDGLMCDALCQFGSAYNFGMQWRKVPPHPLPDELDRVYGNQGPMVKRLIWFARRMPCGGHLEMDNLFISVNIARILMAVNRVTCAGTMRANRGQPACVIQKASKNSVLLSAAQGNIKVAVLKGDHVLSDLVCVSHMDATTAVTFLSSRIKSVGWVTKSRRIWDYEQKCKTNIQFLRLNINDNYNQRMGMVDLHDQIREAYRSMKFGRRTKWTWAMYLFHLNVALTNSYIIYKMIQEVANMTPMSHYDFLFAVFKCWMCEKEFKSNMGTQNQAQSADDLRLEPDAPLPKRAKYQKAKYLTKFAPDDGRFTGGHTFVDTRSLNLPPRTCCFHKHNRPFGERKKQASMRCDQCERFLCLSCWNPYHDRNFTPSTNVNPGSPGYGDTGQFSNK